MDRALHRIAVDHRLATLVLKQVYGMGRVVPQEMIGPAARLTGCIHVGATKEVGLYVHLQDLKLTFLNPFVNPLVTGIEATDVPSHSHDASFPLNFKQRLRVLDAVGDRDLDQHMSASAHHLFRMLAMQRCWSRENHLIVSFDAPTEIPGMMRD